ncbi:acyltransferase family protein [Hymenobacter sp. BT491]|uniref:acyltransferase family protein n=1 Tax=Hymenobacter sp. BT491 TaxID=2766779 RepID=UPI00165390A5|nr:acyltransferase family protein [Hymenobacter sp. BT491]MBC6988923.1 acyltransferase [Hymenobacter sp. BT491]
MSAIRPVHANNFNFLRLLFASLVLVSHAPELRDGNRSHELLTRLFGQLSFGEVAVSGFFLLSGYLITQSWERKPDLRDYFEKRIRRIVPGFLVAFGLSVVLVGPFAVAEPVGAYFAHLSYRALLTTALQLRPPEVLGVFPGQPHQFLNGALYTVS